MSTKTIVLLVLGVVIFGLAVCGGGAAFWYFKIYKAEVPDVGPLPGQALSLPADTGVLGGLNLKALFTSPIYKEIAAGDVPSASRMSAEEAAKTKAEVKAAIEKGMNDAEAKMGFRPDRDLDRLVLAVANAKAPTPEMVGFLLGRFDQAKITRALEATLKAENGTLTPKTVEGVSVLVATSPGSPGIELAFLDPSTLALGTAASVDAVLANRAKSVRPLEANADLMGLARGIDPAAGYWLALDQTAASRIDKETGGASPLPVPRTLTLAGSFDGGLTLAGQMADEASAVGLRETLEQGLQMVRMQAAENPEVQKVQGAKELLERIAVKAEGRKVTLTVPSGTASVLSGLIAGAALPNLMQSNAANEPPAIGDIPSSAGDVAPGQEGIGAAPAEPPPAPVRPKAATPRPAAKRPVPTPTPEVAAPAEEEPEPEPARPAAATAQPVRVGGGIKEPRKTKNVTPFYPAVARNARVQGVVIMECVIDTAGKVSSVKILRGIPLLDGAATDAVKQWEYEPTVLNGVPVPVIMTVTVNFKLS